MTNTVDVGLWLGLMRAQEILRAKINTERERARRQTDPQERRWYAGVLRSDREALRAVRAATRRLS